MRLLIIGNRAGTNIGESFEKAALELGHETTVVESRLAMEGNKWLRRFSWRFLGRRPIRLNSFSENVVEVCRKARPDCLIAMGIAPLNESALHQISLLGVRKICYLTDDPWCASYRSSWFLKALPLYDVVFSVRKANLRDLLSLGCKEVRYLPFGYDPEHFYPDSSGFKENIHLDSDILFAGGADSDRIPYISSLIKAGFRVGLYGSYWEKFRETRAYTKGQVDPVTLRKTLSNTKIALCLVRRANRDGNSMRTFEIPAVGACMLTEDTEEHRKIFGEEGKAVVYFKSIDEMLFKMKFLLQNELERKRLAQTAHDLIVNGKHTYKDRLVVMLNALKPIEEK